MKKTLSTILIITLTSIAANAQQSFELDYYKMIIKINSEWGKWESKWAPGTFSNGENMKFVVHKIDDSTFEVKYISAYGDDLSEPFKEIIYDPIETEKIRNNHSNPYLTVYKYKESEEYIWTDNITLNDLARDSSKWTSTKEAKMYAWTSDGGLLYTSGTNLKPEQIKYYYQP